jgi:hypothetical protein
MTDRREEDEESLPSLQEEEEEPQQLHLNIFWQGERGSDSGSGSEEDNLQGEETQVEEMDEEDFAYLEKIYGFVPRPRDCDVKELQEGKGLVGKDERETLPWKALNQLREGATTGIENKFEIMDSINLEVGDPVATLSKAYRVDLRVAEVSEIVHRYDMQYVFNIPTEFVTVPSFSIPVPASGTQTLDLFKKHYEPDMETIKKSCDFVAMRGQKCDLDNLRWSGELILNCCSPDLRTRIET